MSRFIAYAAVVLLFVGNAHAQVVLGQGSSAQLPLASRFAANCGPTKYTATSSVLGLGALAKGAITGTDFALSDIPATPCSAASPFLNVPYGIGLMAVHAKPGAVTGISLNACLLDSIYKCITKTWNAPNLVAVNPRLKSISAPIKRIARADVSGTTFTFTNFLGKACPASWKFGSITLLSNAAALKPCFATMSKASGTGGVLGLFNTNPNSIVYISAGRASSATEAKLKARSGATYFLPGNVNTATLLTGLNYGIANCNPLLDVTAKGITYPLAYVAFFMVNRKRAGKKNPPGVKTLCSCVASTKNTQIFAGLLDFKAAPTAMKTVALARCNQILLT